MQFSKRRQKASSSDKKAEFITLDEALSFFIKAHDASGHSEETKKDYYYSVRPLLRYMSETFHYKTIGEIKESDIIDWLSFLRNTTSKLGRPYSSRSIETYCRDVKVFFQWLVRHNYLKSNPMTNIDTPKVEKALIRVFSEDELTLLDKACDRLPNGKALTPDERQALGSRDRAFLWLLLSTGIRISEACGLLFSDIDWNMGMVYVRGKGAKERKVPFGRVARQHLDTYIRYWRGGTTESNEHVFLNAFGGPMNKVSGGQIFLRLKREAGITDKRVSAHTCRHWFAVNAIKNGVPSTVLQGWLGHESLDMINVYVRLAEQDNHDLYLKFSPVDSLKMHRTPRARRAEIREWRTSRKKKE